MSGLREGIWKRFWVAVSIYEYWGKGVVVGQYYGREKVFGHKCLSTRYHIHAYIFFETHECE
jgi:hypothetical protein